MGNPSWGAGYHQGAKDTFGPAFGQGTAAGAAGTLLLGGVVFGVVKLKEALAARHERKLAEAERVAAEGIEATDGGKTADS